MHFKQSDYVYINNKYSKTLLATAVPSILPHTVFINVNDCAPDVNFDDCEPAVLIENNECKRSIDEDSDLVSKPAKKIRFIGDLRREDFTSQEAFEVVQRHQEECRKKLKLKDKRIGRLNRKIGNVEELLDHLRDDGFIGKEGYDVLKLKSSPALSEILKNILSKKACNAYVPEVKEFACSLIFYSTSAYNYVRENFLKALPCPQTVRRWFTKVDLSPGIGQPILESIRSMIKKERTINKDLQWSLQLDEMSIKKQIEFKNNVWYGCVDIGGHGNKGTSEQASYALVIMLVLINGHFKTPIAYYVLKSLSGQARANLVIKILLVLYEYGISDVRSITFDGAATNFSMITELGADFRNINDPCFFKHPATNEPVYVIPDACHMLKLIRNAIATRTLIDSDNNTVEWKYIQKLVDVQEKEGVHLGTKIRRRHVDFEKEKMKVKLAAQTLSTRVSDALNFMQGTDSSFKGVGGTVTFCKNINDAFDILNSKSKYGKSEFQNAISPDSLDKIESKAKDLILYIQTLTCNENGKSENILSSKRKIGFLGFIVALRSVIALAQYLFNNQLISYLLTYKMSQDHLETFFSCVRQMGGFKNNPTCYQFQHSYKRLVSHVNSIIVVDGNCIQQDKTEILKINNKCNNDDLFTLSSVSFDHDYGGTNDWCWSEYHDNVITYIAGSIVKSIKKHLNCQMCIDSLETAEINCNLIKIKNRMKSDIFKNKYGLISPTSDVVNICKVCEKVIRITGNLFVCRNIIDLLMLQARKLLLPMDLFKNLDICMQKNIVDSHRFQLINNISKKYFNIKLNHEARSIQDKTERIRSYHNKIVLFKNQ